MQGVHGRSMIMVKLLKSSNPDPIQNKLVKLQSVFKAKSLENCTLFSRMSPFNQSLGVGYTNIVVHPLFLVAQRSA